MRSIHGIALLFLASVASFCSPLPIVTDPYLGSMPGWVSGGAADDVIGLYRLFDIESIAFTDVTVSNVELTVRFNYNNGDATLGSFPFGSAPPLVPGDILFSIGSSAAYGIALQTHGSFTPGHLYTITNGLLSGTVYNPGSGYVYRPNELVWMDELGSSDAGAGTVLTSRIWAGSTPTSEVVSVIDFTPTAAFLSDLAGGMDIHFASAICANDVLDGHVQAEIPEPATLVLMASALLVVGLLRAKKD